MKSMRRIFIILAALLPVTVLASSASWAETKLEASIFSFDGKDFVRTNTTLMDKGQSATNTKLDRSSAAYKALIEKRSYTGQRLSLVKTMNPTTHRLSVKTAN
jgi:hypothetical protein